MIPQRTVQPIQIMKKPSTSYKIAIMVRWFASVSSMDFSSISNAEVGRFKQSQQVVVGKAL